MLCQLPCQGGGTAILPHSNTMKSLICILLFLVSSVIGSFTSCPSQPPCKCRREWTRIHFTCISIPNTATLSALIPQTQSVSTWVNVINSNLTTLSANALGTLRLEKLQINSSNVANVTEDAFRNLKDLRGLVLADNQLTAVPSSSLTPLVNLELLGLAGNKISKISKDDVKFLTNLRYLSLSENFITDIERDSFPTSLEHLALVANNLESLNGSLMGLSNLNWLLLSNNSLRALNKQEFESLENLDKLNLAHNVLEDIAGVFEDLTQLRALNLNGNRIQFIEDVFNYMPRLKELSLRGNQIRRLNNLGNLPALTTIDLSENNMKLIFMDAFENSPNVIALDLSNNDLKEFPGTALKPLKSLVTLDLSRNRLESPVDVSQLKLPTLKHLFLSGNRLKMLPHKLFESFPSLQDLDVSFNSLTTLDFFSAIPLRIIHLHGNPLRCDLKTMKVLDKMSSRLIDKPRCINTVLPISHEELN